MSEDHNLSNFRRRVSYFDRRASISNNYKGILYFPQACERSMYPGSFLDSGLYVYGASLDTVRPNWDITEAKPLNWDKPSQFYTTNEQFHKEFYKNNTTIYDSKMQVPFTRPPCHSGGMKTVTGYRKPSIQNKQVWLSEERYTNDW
jgi:hypothetical protein